MRLCLWLQKPFPGKTHFRVHVPFIVLDAYSYAPSFLSSTYAMCPLQCGKPVARENITQMLNDDFIGAAG